MSGRKCRGTGPALEASTRNLGRLTERMRVSGLKESKLEANQRFTGYFKSDLVTISSYVLHGIHIIFLKL